MGITNRKLFQNFVEALPGYNSAIRQPRFVAAPADGASVGTANYHDLLLGLFRKEFVSDTVQASVDAAVRGDRVYIFPGLYPESVVISGLNKAHISLYGILAGDYADDGNAVNNAPGFSGPGILPSAINATGLQIDTVGVKVKNLNINHGPRTIGTPPGSGPVALHVRGEWCHVKKCNLFANFGTGLRMGPGTIAQVGVTVRGTGSRNVVEECLFNSDSGDPGAGVVCNSSDFGAATDNIIRRCHFKNLATVHVGEDDAGVIGAVRNLLLQDNTHDRNEAGAAPTDFLDLDSVGSSGLVTGCKFWHPTNASAVLQIAAGIGWVANATEAGYSTARPA